MGDQLHKGHRERMRNKFYNSSESFLEHEILELLLFYFIPRRNTNDIAHILINKFKHLDNVLNQPLEKLEEIHCIGKPTAFFLKFIDDLCKDYESYKPEPKYILCVEDAKDYMKSYLKKEKNPKDCILLILDYELEIESRFIFNIKDFYKNSPEVTQIFDFFMMNDCNRAIIIINNNNNKSISNNHYIKFIKNFKKELMYIKMDIMDCVICDKNRAVSIRDISDIMF